MNRLFSQLLYTNYSIYGIVLVSTIKLGVFDAEFDAKNRKKDIREVYDQVPEGIRIMSEAVPYLLGELGLTPCDDSEGIESHRIAIDVKKYQQHLN